MKQCKLEPPLFVLEEREKDKNKGGGRENGDAYKSGHDLSVDFTADSLLAY